MIDRCLVVAGDLIDEDWQRLEPLLPSMDPQRGGRWRDHRQVINGILWRVDNGAKWDQIPERYGPAKTCYDRFARWEQDGTWARSCGGCRPTRTQAGISTGLLRSIPAWCGLISTLRVPVKGAESGRVAGSPRDGSLARRTEHQTASAG